MNKILYIQYTNPAGYPPLEHSSRILANAGRQVLFLGTQVSGVEDLCFPEHTGITVRLLSSSASGWRQKIHYILFVLWTVYWTVRWRPTWVYASDLFACPAAAIIGMIPGISILYHEHDSPAGDHERPRSTFMRGVLWARRRLARHAQLCVLPNSRRVDRFKEATGRQKQTLCVWNCPQMDEAIEPRPPRDEDTLDILYHGSIVPNRLPETVITALAHLPVGVKLTVIGYETSGHRGYIRQLQNHARQLGLEERVHFIGTLPLRTALLEQCRRHDVGLSLMPLDSSDLNEQAMTGASNKPFDYLACGLGLLVPDLPDWRDMFVAPGYGLACRPDDAGSIATALRYFFDHPIGMRRMGEKGRRRILSEWHYEYRFTPILEHLS